MPEINFDHLQDYLTSLVPPREPVLQEMEAYAEKNNFPALGPVCGYYCYQLARMMRATSVFELGSGYGYSTAWFAKAVRENGGGVVHHTVWDDKLSAMAQEYLTKLGYSDLVKFHNAEAVATLRQTPGAFDIIFNDIDKEGYPDSLPTIKSKLRSGGLLIIDNMIWHGQILDADDHEESTEAIRRFTHDVTTDSDWIVSLTPIRDGMIVAYKK
ncbi:MAG: O-methyltransferase [Anaerolineales bacterium]|nr:MAG: O-methyltransferase [Anaerolineales bacterium]